MIDITRQTATEQANECMRVRGYCVVCLPFPVPIGSVREDFGIDGHKAVVLSATDAHDFDEQARLLGVPDDPEKHGWPYYYYRVAAE